MVSGVSFSVRIYVQCNNKNYIFNGYYLLYHYFANKIRSPQDVALKGEMPEESKGVQDGLLKVI